MTFYRAMKLKSRSFSRQDWPRHLGYGYSREDNVRLLARSKSIKPACVHGVRVSSLFGKPPQLCIWISRKRAACSLCNLATVENKPNCVCMDVVLRCTIRTWSCERCINNQRTIGICLSNFHNFLHPAGTTCGLHFWILAQLKLPF